MSNSKVANYIRNYNKRSIEARAKWRAEYAWLTKQIRQLKVTVAHDSRTQFNFIDPEACKDAIYSLKTLQSRANEMMQESYKIKMHLIKSAYKYA